MANAPLGGGDPSPGANAHVPDDAEDAPPAGDAQRPIEHMLGAWENWPMSEMEDEPAIAPFLFVYG